MPVVPDLPGCPADARVRPGLGGQLSGAGDAVASAVQEAIGALDSMLGKAGGGDKPRRQERPCGRRSATARSARGRPG